MHTSGLVMFGLAYMGMRLYNQRLNTHFLNHLLCIADVKVYWIIKNWTPTNRPHHEEVSIFIFKKYYIIFEGASLRTSCSELNMR